MNFDTIDKSISVREQHVAKEKLQGITLELGTREDNYHIGSALGGNNGQLIALMSFHHELVNDHNLSIETDRGLMRWGSLWMERASRKDIRQKLDVNIPVPKYTPLDKVTNDPRYSLGPNVASWRVLFFAEGLCQKLARELDNGDESNVQVTAFALIGFPMEVILMAVRKHIQIERLVRHNLDEHPDFGNILSKINRKVDQ